MTDKYVVERNRQRFLREQRLKENHDDLLLALNQLVDAMHRYEMDVEGNAPPEHLKIMRNAHEVLDRAEKRP